VVVGGGGDLFAYNGLVSSVVVSSGGLALLLSGTASDVTVKGGAVFEATGTVEGGVISSGGIEVISGNAYYGKGEAAGVTVDQGGILAVLPGGSASGTLGAGQTVSTGVVAFGDGTAPFVGKSGGPAALSAGATEYVLSGGVVSNIVLNAAGGSGYGGTQVVYAGGTAGGVQVYGRQIVSGGDVYGAVVASGGAQTVFSGGTVSGTQVAKGGTEFVAGTASGSTVSAGGVIENAGNLVAPVIAGGILEDEIGKITGTINFTGTGGTLMFYAASPPTNTISGFAAGDEITLKGLTYVSGATATVATAGVVTINNGGQLFKLHIAGTTVGEAGFAFGPGGVLTFSGGAAATRRISQPVKAASFAKPYSSVAAFAQESGHDVARTARASGYGHGIAMTSDPIRPAAADHTALLAKWFQ
jgi:autotransporter passenger strand-loop-strand repeat protein